MKMRMFRRTLALFVALALMLTLGGRSGLATEASAATGRKAIAGNVAQIAASAYGNIGILFTDGTVATTHSESLLPEWTDVVEICFAGTNLIGLRSDGTVLCDGMDLSDWSDIQKIVVCEDEGCNVVGIRKDGTVVTRGEMLDDPENGFDFSGWSDIQDVVVRWDVAVGLKKNGTAVITGWGAKKEYAEHQDFFHHVKDWKNIATIMDGHGGVYAIDKNGKVYQTNADEPAGGRHYVNKWKNIQKLMPAYVGEGYYGLTKDGSALVSVMGGENYTALEDVVDIAVAEATKLVGLKADGTVVFEEGSYYKENGYINEPGDLDQWTDIVKLTGSRSCFFVALKADGTAVSNRDNEIISKWENLKDIFIYDYDIVVGVQKNGALLCNTCDLSVLDEWTIREPLLIDNAAASTISAGTYHSVRVNADGTVSAAGRKDNGRLAVEGWKDIVAVSANSHTLGLRSDGTVVAAGPATAKCCEVSGWTDIVAISAGSQHSLGLCADGTAVAAGNPQDTGCDVGSWTGIVAIAAGDKTSYGLKSDGTVEVAGYKVSGQNGVDSWTDIVAISAGGQHVLGLKADGTVVAAGSNGFGQCKVSEWSDIVAISAGNNFSLGLKSDGSVVAVGDNAYKKCDVSGWTDVVAISAGMSHAIGLCADGSILTSGSNTYGQNTIK